MQAKIRQSKIAPSTLASSTIASSTIAIVDYELVCAAGVGVAAVRASLAQQRTGLVRNDFPDCALETYIGKVAALDEVSWSAATADWQSRNNALIELTLQQGSLLNSLAKVRATVGAERIGLIMGSSTSSIDRAEAAYRLQREQNSVPGDYLNDKVLNPHAPALYTAHRTGITGPWVTLSTACSSSAKVFATAARWLNTGVVDAVLVGGADSLCLTVLYGFHSLQLVSTKPCSPFDESRDGINLGEGAGFALLTRGDLVMTGAGSDDASRDVRPNHVGPNDIGIVLSGFGESSDAHHMSHPHPEGGGAKLAIQQALTMAQLQPEQIDYVNLHGTSSRVNDLVEGNLMAQLFSAGTPMSSTKGWTGHTLGAAGIVEAIIAMDTFHTGVLPGNLHCKRVDPEIALQLAEENRQASPQHVMSNSFGFGGNNASLIFSRAL